MDQVLSIRLAAHGGVVAARDLHDAGVSEQTVRTAVRRGELIRVRRGAYVDGRRYREAQPDERYRLRVAAVLRTRPKDAASHHAALAIFELPLVGCDLGRLDTVGEVRATIVRRGLVVHPGLAGPTTVVDGVPTVPVADAVVQATGTSGLKTGLVAADAALHLGRCTVESLHEAVARVSTPMSSTALAKLVDLVEPLAESPGESLTRMVLRTAGLPVRSQVRISDAMVRLARVDFLVGDKVVVEFDGQVKYAGAGGDELFREKQREDWLRELGYEVVRVVWSDLADPARLVARVRAALARAAHRAS